MKILVTVGTHDQGFDALLELVKPWANKQDHQWTIQSGHSQIIVEGARQQAFFSPDEMHSFIHEADLVISHLGCGIAREVQQEQTPTLFMCRSKHRYEHIDDHQLELKEALQDRPGIGFIEPGDDVEGKASRVIGQKPNKPENLDRLVLAVKNWLDD